MEYIIIEKQRWQALLKCIEDVCKISIVDAESIMNEWVENETVTKQLHVSLRTLQTYRDRGILPFSKIDRKIYYKKRDINDLIDKYYKHAGNNKK